MAEETNPTPSRHRLEKLTEDYISERRKRRAKTISRLFGVALPPETDVSQMAEFNKAMNMHHKELVAFQNKVFDSERERVKQRAQVIGKMLDTMRGVINTRATAGTAMNRERLVQSGKNLDMLYKGLEMAVAEADAQAEGSKSLAEEDLADEAYRIHKMLRGDRYEADQAAIELMRKVKTPADRDEVVRRIESAYQQDVSRGTGAFQDASRIDMLKSMRTTLESAEKADFTAEELESMGIDPANAQDKEYAELGFEMIMHPERAATNFSVHQSRINNTQAHHGGSMGATLAALAGWMSHSSDATLDEVISDLGYEAGLTAEEAALVSNAGRQKEVLLGQLYNPNAPPAVVQARDALLKDEGFLSFKDSMGFKTDRAAFIALRRQFRKDRKNRIKHDRNLLRKNKPKRTTRVSAALDALKQNAERPEQSVPAPSAQAVQPAKPEDTIKTGGTVGGQTGK